MQRSYSMNRSPIRYAFCDAPSLRIDYVNKIKEFKKLLIMNKPDCLINIMTSDTLLSNPPMGGLFKVLVEIEQNI